MSGSKEDFIVSRTKDFIDSHLPIPFRISDWDNGDRILYQCPKCRASFQFFGDLEKYCHNCGKKSSGNFLQHFWMPTKNQNMILVRKKKFWHFYVFCIGRLKREKRKQKWRRRDDLRVMKPVFTTPLALADG